MDTAERLRQTIAKINAINDSMHTDGAEHEAGLPGHGQGETVAVITLLEDRKRGLLPLVSAEWRRMRFLLRRVIVIAVRNDASDDTCIEFADEVKRDGWASEVHFVNVSDAPKPNTNGLGSHYNQEFLARMAVLREGARRHFLTATTADWALWIDSDITLPAEGFLRLWSGLVEAERAGESVPYPRANAALCCTRYGGAPIPQWLDYGEPTSYIQLEPDSRHVARVIGFGSMLMRRQTLADIGWFYYAELAANRIAAIERGDKSVPGCQGEDVYWCWLHERLYHVPPMVDTGCRARHYDADGSYWRYDRTMQTTYVTDDARPEYQVAMTNSSGREWRLPRYKLTVPPGASVKVSPEVSELLETVCMAQDDGRELVAICVLLDDRKADLLNKLVPLWDSIDVGDRDAVYIVCRQDASQETCDRFAELTTREVRWWAHSDSVAKVVRGLDYIGHGVPGGYSNVIFLHRMAMLREVTRIAALATKVNGEPVKPADWLLWLDSDIDPTAGEPPFLRLHQTLTETTGPMAPRLASGIYPTRMEGQPIPQEVSDTEGDTRYLPLRPGARLLSDMAGFGCVLGSRETFEAVSWEGYTDYREQRVLHLELSGQPAGVLGEDCWFFRAVRERFGGGLVVDCDVRCNHYRDDGSHWHYREADGELLPALRERPRPVAVEEVDRVAIR